MNEAIELIKYLTPTISIIAIIVIIVIKAFEYWTLKLNVSEVIQKSNEDIAHIKYKHDIEVRGLDLRIVEEKKEKTFERILDPALYATPEKVVQLLMAIDHGKKVHSSDIDKAIIILQEHKHN